MGRLSSSAVVAWPPTVTFLLPLPTLDARRDSPTTFVSHPNLGLVAHDELRIATSRNEPRLFPTHGRRKIRRVGDFGQVSKQVLTLGLASAE